MLELSLSHYLTVSAILFAMGIFANGYVSLAVVASGYYPTGVVAMGKYPRGLITYSHFDKQWRVLNFQSKGKDSVAYDLGLMNSLEADT